MCDPHDAVTAWQRGIILPIPNSVRMAVISRLVHSSLRAFPTSTRVVGWTGRRKIATCCMTCSIGLRPGDHADQSIWTMVSCWMYSSTTVRSGVGIHEDELGSDCTSVRCNVDVHDIIHVGYAGHQASRHDVHVSSSASADTSPLLKKK